MGEGREGRSVAQSWGRLWEPTSNLHELDPETLSFPPPERDPLLPFGNGRSYGDVCTNRSGTLLDTRSLNRILGFDSDAGIIRCEGGVLLSQILDLIVPEGWFLPVTPGTRYVTVGGAIANDVHGKNHHRAGTFGRHVRSFELLRSDGHRRVCTPDREADWFEATIGGLGLTGLITWAEIDLKSVAGRGIASETIRFRDLSEFFDLSAASDATHEYTVSWIDCMAGEGDLGRGWFFRGNHASDDGDEGVVRRSRTIDFFVDPPVSLVNRFSLRLFNLLYYHRPVPSPGVVDYEPFFYPLDRIRHWNRMYGPRGFYQFQCVVPESDGEVIMEELLREIARRRQGSFLAVLKIFGELESPGLLSFPRPGPTLALDFPNRGPETRSLLRSLEEIVVEAGGAIYPAKDAQMAASTFQAAYPNWRRLEGLRDPRFSSDFWNRVTGSQSSSDGTHRRTST